MLPQPNTTRKGGNYLQVLHEVDIYFLENILMYLYAHRSSDFADYKINFIPVGLDLWLGGTMLCNIGMLKTREHSCGEEGDVASVEI